MQPSLLTPLLCVLLWLTSVDGKLNMTVVNATVSTVPVPQKFAMLNLGPEKKLKASGISISCILTNSDSTPLSLNATIVWSKLGNKSKNAFAVTSAKSSDQLRLESTFTVQKPLNDSMSAYECTGTSGGKNITSTAAFKSLPLLSITVSGGFLVEHWETVEYPDLVVRPNEAATVTCVNSGFPKSVPYWMSVDSKGKETSIGTGSNLQFNRTSYATDRGFYVCRSENSEGSNSFKIFLRVKNSSAYLLPMILSLCAAAIAAAFIVAYEIGEYRRHELSAGTGEPCDADHQPAEM